ncbi:MAG: hypothetical protein NTZ18_03045 [Candidatus Komeilibacteria bacterium]|nr:hypothetical protein [Candidatus Komeilibacteria bacterium]
MNLALFKKLKSGAGFTVAEMLTVAAIFVIVGTLVIAGFNSGTRRSELILATDEMASNIRKMQTATLTGIATGEIAPTGGYGLYFNLAQNNQYLLFRDGGDQVYTAGSDIIIQTIALPAGITLSGLTADPLTVVFKPPKPTIYFNGATAANLAAISLISSNVSDKQGQIAINRITGQVSSQLINQ